MSRFAPLAVLVLTTACTSSESVQWVEGMGFTWELFNHRLSYLEYQVDSDDVSVVVVGGTSTTLDATGAPPDLPAECDPDETAGALPCDEFPFNDVANVFVTTGQTEGRRIASGLGEVTVLADADGESTSIDITMSRAPKGDVIAIVRGLTIDTDAPLSGGTACYDPAYGWHPRRIAVLLGEPVVSGDVVTVPVEMAFEAGESLEDERLCIDAVNDQARVDMTVQVQVISAGTDAVYTDVSQQQAFAFSGNSLEPGEQPAPDLAERTVDIDFAGPVGWSEVDFRFHVDDPEDRGAYLRSLSFDLFADLGAASGDATNASPGTQLSAFDYTFDGRIASLPDDYDVTRRIAQDDVDIEVEDGRFVVQDIDLEPR